MLIFCALAGGGQQLVTLNLPNNGQHIDSPLFGTDQRGAKVNDGLALPLLEQLVLFLVHGCSLLFPLFCAKEEIFTPKLPLYFS